MAVKPSIVFDHGIWADGSCFSKVIPPLRAEGYQVMSAQYGLDSNVEDVAGDGPHLRAGQQPNPPCRALLRRQCHHRLGYR